MTPVMENHHGYPPPPQQQMYQPSYAPSSGVFNVQRKKQMRATQVCPAAPLSYPLLMVCRRVNNVGNESRNVTKGTHARSARRTTSAVNIVTRHRRSMNEPILFQATCTSLTFIRTDKNMEKLLGYMEATMEKLDDVNERLERVERANAYTRAGAASQPTQVQRASQRAQPAPQEEAAERKPGLDDHRTAPHKLLLLWPSVQELLRAADVKMNDGYVMEAEDRGILRLYTRGEGIDEHDGTQPGGAASPAHSDDSSAEANVPTPPEGLWGTGFPQTPNSEIRRSEPSWGGLKPDNTLDLELSTIATLLESYISHIHIMHPFLDKTRLRSLFEVFIKRYCSGPPKPSPFAVPSSGSDTDTRPLKRQRSNGSTMVTTTGPDGATFRSQNTERSPGNAIVYLVLALGKICTHGNPLPGITSDNKLNANSLVTHQLTGNQGLVASSPLSTTIKPSPISPKSTPGTTHPTPPRFEGHMHAPSRSRRSSTDGLPTTGARNLDVIPGIAYYAKAAEILGDQGDGNDLVHAQMFLLAALYKGQLARVKESMSWITTAGRAVLNLLDRYKLYNENYWTGYGDVHQKHKKSAALIKDKRDSMIVLAAWTCLQLESDILAELPLPQSGIQNKEDLLVYPRDVPEDDSYSELHPNGRQPINDNILVFYTFQMWLRKRLNQIHREIYGPDCLHQPLNQVRATLTGHEDILFDWRKALPPPLSWHDNDDPATDILAARLRAKYWGARYVVNRPFLDYALHIMPHSKGGALIQNVAKDVHGNPRDAADIHLFEAIEGMGEEEVWKASKRCIDAAMMSTEALDGVPERLIVTNIHGTAHA